MVMTPRGAGGRPTRYTTNLATEICDRLAEGELLVDIVADERMPGRTTVWRWHTENEQFRSMFANAREAQAHTIAEKGVKIALAATAEDAHAARVKFDGYKWFASKLLPRVYGDKLLHTGGDGEGPIGHKLALDYSRFNPQQKAQFLALLEIAMGPQTDGTPLIEGGGE